MYEMLNTIFEKSTTVFDIFQNISTRITIKQYEYGCKPKSEFRAFTIRLYVDKKLRCNIFSRSNGIFVKLYTKNFEIISFKEFVLKYDLEDDELRANIQKILIQEI